MAEITMPKLSDTMEEGKVIKWLKQPGDTITEGEPIAEVETDKANVEMEAFEPGIMKQLLIHEGETVPVGTPIAEVQAPETAAAPKAPPEEAPAAPEQPEIPATKTPSPYATEQVPTVTTPPAPEAAAPAPQPEQKPAPQPQPQAPAEERVMASPLARRIAEEQGIDISKVHGTGPNGRVTEADIRSYLGQAQPTAAPPPAPEAPAQAPQPPAAPARGAEVPSEEHDLSRMRKTIAHRMSEAKRTIPHFYVTADIDMDWAARVREELNSMGDSQPRVSFTDMIVKACALTLAEFPDVNGSYSDDKLVEHKEVNVAIAVALEDGLVAPVVHNANSKPLRQIAGETKQLAEHARSNALRQSEFTGATFTVSNLGMFNVESFSSIIDPPQAASLAVGTITDQPIVENEQVVIAKRMKATLSADHRVLDGARAARFLDGVRKRLESPVSLL